MKTGNGYWLAVEIYLRWLVDISAEAGHACGDQFVVSGA
jgi:hypothetical protein